MKNQFKHILIIFLLAGSFGFIGAGSVMADDDDGEENEFWHFWEEDQNKEDAYDQRSAPAVPQSITQETVREAARVTRIFQEMRDSDNDGFKDAYDRYPGENDLLYVMDSDHDGISDAEDRHAGENDFSFIFADANENGIADDLEALIKSQ